MVDVDVDELEDAILMVSEPGTAARAWVGLDTGAVHVGSGLADDEQAPLPDDIGRPERYVPVPTVQSLGLGLGMVFDFVGAAMPEEDERVRKMFKRPDAYREFADLVEARDLGERWHAFREAQTHAILAAWCAEYGLQLAA